MHTKTPWRVESYPFDAGQKSVGIFSELGKYVGSATSAGMKKEDALENARFIARAVNSHEALVEALRDLFEYVSQSDEIEKDEKDELGKILYSAQSALALAEK